jgi:hypothetical protein
MTLLARLVVAGFVTLISAAISFVVIWGGFLLFYVLTFLIMWPLLFGAPAIGALVVRSVMRRDAAELSAAGVTVGSWIGFLVACAASFGFAAASRSISWIGTHEESLVPALFCLCWFAGAFLGTYLWPNRVAR